MQLSPIIHYGDKLIDAHPKKGSALYGLCHDIATTYFAIMKPGNQDLIALMSHLEDTIKTLVRRVSLLTRRMDEDDKAAVQRAVRFALEEAFCEISKEPDSIKNAIWYSNHLNEWWNEPKPTPAARRTPSPVLSQLEADRSPTPPITNRSPSPGSLLSIVMDSTDEERSETDPQEPQPTPPAPTKGSILEIII